MAAVAVVTVGQLMQATAALATEAVAAVVAEVLPTRSHLALVVLVVTASAV
jgi:hypothetical protein